MVQLKEYQEGKISFLSADLDHYSENKSQPTTALPVFYNPRMTVNRDLSVLFLSAHQEQSKVKLLCEPLAGSGIRAMRYLKECSGDFNSVLFDVNPVAVDIATQNLKLNGIEDRAEVKRGDARILLLTESREKRFDFVDVDPFGTPAPFLNSAMQSLSPRQGLLALTATDMPVLCGIFPRVAQRKYGGYSIKAPFLHEIAVRLLIGLAYHVAGMNDQSVTPLVSLSADHYVRVWLKVKADRTTSNQQADDIGFITYCPACMEARMFSSTMDSAEVVEVHRDTGCTGRLRVAGPLWIGELYDQNLLTTAENLLNEQEFIFNRRTPRILDKMIGEAEMTNHMYVDIHALCDLHSFIPPRLSDIVEKLSEQGHNACRTHFKPTAIRTEASVREIARIIEELNRSR